MGGVISERAGIANIALEGFLADAAHSSVCSGRAASPHFSVLLPESWRAGFWAGLHALFVQALRMDQIISGLALNLLAAGGSPFSRSSLLLGRVFRRKTLLLPQARFPRSRPSASPPADVPPLPDALGCRIASRWRKAHEARAEWASRRNRVVTWRSRSRAFSRRWAACIWGLPMWERSPAICRRAKGYIALAAVIFGRWKPIPTALGALLFGLLYAVQTQIQIGGKTLVFLGRNVEQSPAAGLPAHTRSRSSRWSVSRDGSVAPAGLGKAEE